MWDSHDSPKLKDHIFMGEIRIPMCELSGLKYDYCEERRYPLKPRSKENKRDNVDGDLSIKVGMVWFEEKPTNIKNLSGDRQTQAMIYESERLADESMASVNRSLKMVENSKQLGVDTLDGLHRQGEQIRNIQADVDDINYMQNRADRHMRGISSVGGAIANKFTPKFEKSRDHNRKADKEYDKSRKGKLKERVQEEKQTVKEEVKRNKYDWRKGGKAKTEMYKEDVSLLSEAHQQKVEQTDRVLDQIGDGLLVLKEIARDMGDEIEDHNRRLEQLNGDMREANVRMSSQNRRITSRLN